ncbi:hypothetical protein FH972_021211 [Carpinus fangiana]|uniref:Uncharacterized protein n=1 Tax=Carpinus fangiana TaxID=176857 RepID=A0A5N6KNV7_9ROSI|nr:hypothetical protein FH972_021211 [Carpinus fangiana]
MACRWSAQVEVDLADDRIVFATIPSRKSPDKNAVVLADWLQRPSWRGHPHGGLLSVGSHSLDKSWCRYCSLLGTGTARTASPIHRDDAPPFHRLRHPFTTGPSSVESTVAGANLRVEANKQLRTWAASEQDGSTLQVAVNGSMPQLLCWAASR